MAPIALTPPRTPELNMPLDCEEFPFEQRRKVTPEYLVQKTMHDRIQSIDCANCAPGEDDAFFVADLGEVYRLHAEWRRRLGRVTPFFATKSNPDPHVLRLLASLGTGFDCASIGEIQTILAMGIDPSRIIFAHTCKVMSAIKFAGDVGVQQMTFDNEDELYKIKRAYPEAQLYLRIVAYDPSALSQLSIKFGARMEATEKLLRLAKELGLEVVGVSFHVGSGGKDPSAFMRAVRDARTVFDQATGMGFQMHTLDIGGGFSSGPLFAQTADQVNQALDAYFPSGVRIIAEPGRYMVNSAFTAAASVMSRRQAEPLASDSNNLKSTMLYINDGVYGNYFTSICEVPPEPRVFRRAGRTIVDNPQLEAAAQNEYSIWGNTCDSFDCVNPSCRLPGEVGVGDWLYYRDMGAYTRCSTTTFNGYTGSHEVIYVCSEPEAAALLDGCWS
ncbi:ornithine decarboxylase [Diplodia corticola]|uniref:ornithine decarboxylase n=1 Tax=Diplodia corticola TaxID=236234 RepID=A0A1J9S7C2_9PEZI|nr:ornithine decarboxylase [Diplodia corticola]OJD36399.1 ornithine decarboxylase [Diplodia corticola]